MRIRITEPNRRALSLSRDEIALGIEPRVKAAQAAAEHRRMNPFPGRALTARALTGEQAHRSWHIAHLNRTLSAGIVQGLGLAFADEVLALPGTAADAPPPTLDLEAARPIALEAGLAVALSGEDIEVPTQITCDALDLPVAAPQWLFDGVPPPTTIGLDELLPRNVGTRLRELLAEGHPVPRAGIVVAEPVEYDSLIDPTGAAAHSQCERDLEAEAFDDEVRQESTRLVYYAWPEEWLPLPAPDAQWRNRLAYEIFRREVTATESTRMPWWRLGVPVALVAFNAAWAPLFADRGAVARTGGAPRTRMPFVTGRGTRFLWQARIEQLTEHIAEARALGGTTAQLAEALRWLPPAGLLPKDAIDARARTSVVFPPNVRVDAAPVPLEQLDALLEDSASGTPIDLGAADEIRVLVPVPQQFFEPELLLIERADAGGEIARAIARFVDVRADWLRRRQSLREKQRQLVVALDGPRVAAVPAAAEDPQRLEPERFDPLLPAPTGVIHRSALLAGMHQHFLLNAPAALTPADDVLFAFVQLDRENPPRELMLQFFANGNWEHRAFWGEDLIPWGVPGTAGRLSQGALPAAGEWIRLEIRAADFGLARTDITGVAFTLFDGRAAWGPVGIVGQDPWLTEALLSGSSQHGDGEGWEFIGAEDVNSPFEDAFGTVATGGRRVVAEFEAVKKDVGALRFGTRGAQQTLAQAIDLHGLRSAMKLLKASLDKTNDGIDFGFIRVQSDLYRLRQSVLKQSQATRFAVSPALSQIAELDSAAATREQLADFYGEIKRTGAQAGPQAAPSGGSTPVAERASFANLATAVSPGLTASLGETLVRADLTGAIGSAPLAFTAAAFKATDFDQRTNIFEGDAMTGLAEVRNVSIAARMEQPRAVETKNFTLSTRVEVTQRLAQAELDLDEIIVSGVPTGELDPATGQPQRATRKLTEITDFAGALIDPSPDAARADEAHYFLGGVDVADFTIGLLRNFEGLVARYRAALERCQKAVNSIEVNAAALARRLPVVDRELAEARQDVATARALLAEDEERAVSVNARRDALIAEHVQFLAFARPRFGKRLEPLPARALDNAFEPDTVPACFAQHDDAPAEVLQMLRLIRQAPVAWFPHARGLLDLVDRAPQLDRLAQLVRQPFAQFAVGTAAAPLVAASQQLALSHSAVLAAVRSGAQSTALAASAAENRVQLARVASLADLAAIVEHAVLSRRAVQEYERIAQVASCLHARLGEVKPALRMVWAERFSQFDAPANLGDLSLLPRFGEVPAELREDIVELAAWLRGRAARDEPRAQALINDLLRVCLLAASHSPVNEIVTGRVLRPLPLLPGTLVPIRPSLLDKVRLGQAVQFFDAGRVTATAVVADLQADAAQVRVIRAEPNAQATEAMSVRFQTTFA
jgi:hypothetical protein